MQNPTILGSFSKALPGAVAINFSQSASTWCSDLCQHKRASCYAKNNEARKPSLQANLSWKQDNQLEYLRAIIESPTHTARIRTAPWVRLSAFGTVPPSEVLQASAPLTKAFRKLAKLLSPLAARVHFPVETADKFNAYRALGFHPRLSLQTQDPDEIADAVRAGIPVSLAVGDPSDKAPRWTLRNKERARSFARKLRALLPGKRVTVCPAILGRAKCGDCTACADPDIAGSKGLKGSKGSHVVIYPLHP
jgi:hypothetical protein